MKYKCMCKATSKESKELRYSKNWLLSKRAIFKIFDDRIECGSWKIMNKDIEKAHIFKTKQYFIPIKVLQLITNNGTYQFGFNPWASPIKHLNIKFTESSVKLGYSNYSIIVRVLFLVIVLYEAWNYFNS